MITVKKHTRKSKNKVTVVKKHYRKLTSSQVSALYKSTPSLGDPYYPKKKLIRNKGEGSTFRIKVSGKSYRVHSHPTKGDSWYSGK